MNYNSSVLVYDSWVENSLKLGDLASDSFKVLLTTSGHTPSQSAHSILADITNELSGNGYSRANLANISLTRAGATVKFDADDVVFGASGGDLTARYFHIFDDSLSGDPLVCYGLIDATPADVTITDGNILTIRWNPSGIFRYVRQ